MSHPFLHRIRAAHAQVVLAVLGLTALWLATALVYALLAQPSATLNTLHARGTRGLPAVVWAGSRDLAGLLQTARGGRLSHD